MEIERRLCIDEAQARAESAERKYFPGGFHLNGYLRMLRERADSDIERLFDENWEPPFPIVFCGVGSTRHCKRVVE